MALVLLDEPQPIPVRLEIVADDGDRAVLLDLEWRVARTGPGEVTLSNADQPIPILVSATVLAAGGGLRLTLGQKEPALPAPVLHRLLRAAHCFAKPCRVQAVRLDTGRVLAEGRKDDRDDAAGDPEWARVVADLAAVQERTGQVIVVPTDRDLTGDEVRAIVRLRRLLRDPVSEETWRDLTIAWPARDAGAMLERLLGAAPGLIFERPEAIALFGARVPLGIVRYEAADALLVNEAEIRARLAAGLASDREIPFRFAPGACGTILLDHLAWRTAAEPPTASGPVR